MLELRFNPFSIFTASRSPAGLYARQRWLGEADTALWKRDSHETIHSLQDKQSADGSWNTSILESIKQLFGLHLTVRNHTENIEMSLDRLMNNALHLESANDLSSGSVVHDDEVRGLPFTSGGTHLFEFCATLFLATIFGRGQEQLIMSHYNILVGLAHDNEEYLFHNWSQANNILRALVVHPLFSESEATTRLVGYLSKTQNQQGLWPNQVPFFQTCNLLAHLPPALSGEQLRRAETAIYES